MLAPIDFSRLSNALDSPRYWAELAVVFLCLAIAWVIDRQIEIRARHHQAAARHPNIRGGVGRVTFSMVGLLLLLLARSAYRAVGGHPFFIEIAIPLLIALAAIRMLMYGMRRLFANATWLKTSERAIAFTIWLLAVLYFVGVLPEIARELDTIALPFGKTPVSLLTIAKGAAAVVLTLIVTLWLSGLIEQRLTSAEGVDTNLRALLAKILRAVLLVVGVLVALEAIGFDLTLLTVFGGALGVGVGLGLQKLAANYIAGFTILLDKSIRLGDMITVDNRQGRVAKVTSRYVVLRSVDGIEAIVPNETLVTTTVLNHSNASHDIRVAAQVRIAYDADVERALRIMEEAAGAEPRVVAAPEPPTAFVTALGEVGVELELVFWVSGPMAGVQALRSLAIRRILAAFAEQGIAIPAPRRDIRMTSVESAAPAGAGAASPSG